jgi:hypothetical protein
MACRSSSFLWAGNVWLPLQGRDGKRCTLARTDPSGRSQLKRTVELIRLAAVSYDQRHILIDRSGVNRLPAKSFREHTHSLPQYPPRRGSVRASEARQPAINGDCSFRVHILTFTIGWPARARGLRPSHPTPYPPRDRGPPLRSRTEPPGPSPVRCGKAGAGRNPHPSRIRSVHRLERRGGLASAKRTVRARHVKLRGSWRPESR